MKVLKKDPIQGPDWYWKFYERPNKRTGLVLKVLWRTQYKDQIGMKVFKKDSIRGCAGWYENLTQYEEQVAIGYLWKFSKKFSKYSLGPPRVNVPPMYVQKMRSPKHWSGIVSCCWKTTKHMGTWGGGHRERERERERESCYQRSLSLYYIHHSSIFPYWVVCVVCYCVVLCFVLFW